MSPIHNHLKKKGGQKDKRAEERLRLATNRIAVYLWEKAEGEEPVKSFCFLAEISASGVGLFSENPIAPGSALRIAFETKDGPTYRATVIWSNRYSLRQNFVGHESLSFRVGIKLRFVSEAERQRYLKYVEEVTARALAVEPGIKF